MTEKSVHNVEAGDSELPTPDPSDYSLEAEKALRWKQDRRIIPLAAGSYFLAYLDRSSIGNAKVLNSSTHDDLLTSTGITNTQYILALTMFGITYAIFEVPSQILLKKLRPSRWIAFLMLSWGAVTVGQGCVHSFASLAVVRILLGAFEAGLFPGLVYYLTFWYRVEERSLRLAFILSSAFLAGAFGGAIAYGVGHMNQVAGLAGWRWLFILEGIPSILAALIIWFCLPDFPENAAWLSEEERAIAISRLAVQGSKGHAKALTWVDVKATLVDWRLWGHYVVYFGIAVPFSSLSLFTPSLTAGLGFRDLRAQLMTVPPYAVSYVVSVLTAWSADRFNARGLHSAALATVGAVGFLASAVLPAEAYSSRYICLIVASSGAYGCISPLLGWLTSNVFSTAAVGFAIGLNISIGAPGQIVGFWIYKEKEKTSGFPTGHWTNSALLFMVAVGSVMLRLYYGRRNKTILRNGDASVRLFQY